MTEGTKTAKLLEHLSSQLKDALIIKHSDRFTAGVPDWSCSYGGRTLWFEDKLTYKPTTIEAVLKESNKLWLVQLLNMAKLDRAAYAAVYVIWIDVPRWIGVPRQVHCLIARAGWVKENLKTRIDICMVDPGNDPWKHFDSNDFVYVFDDGLSTIKDIIENL